MKDIRICIGALCVALAGCGGHQMLSTPAASGTAIKPLVLQTGTAPINWTTFAWGDTNGPALFDGIVAGSDKNMWYTDYYGLALFRMTMAGKTTKFPLTFNPSGITVGSDGKLYVSSAGTRGIMAVVTTSGSVSNKAIPSGDFGYGGGLTVGPDKNVWFVETGHIGKITPGGTITEMPYPDGNTSNYAGGITTGPDGDIWVTESSANVIDSIEPDTGNIVSYTLPCSPEGVLPGQDGALWALCSSYLVRITTSGSYTQLYEALGVPGYPADYTIGPDGQLWFTLSGTNSIAEFNTVTRAFTVYFTPSTYGTTYGVGRGPDGNMWALDSLKNVDVYIPNPLTVSPSSISFHVGNTQNVTVTEAGTASWTATSSSPGVATITQSSPANTFVAKGIGLGSTIFTFTDGRGNTFIVHVKVS